MSKESRMRGIWYWVIFSIVFLTDRCTKYAAFSWLSGEYKFNRFLSFDLSLNRGVSWGLFHSQDPRILFWVKLAVFIIILIFCFHTYIQWKIGNGIIGEVFVLAGAWSNFLDRFLYGGVVDFIDVSFGFFVWPTLNIADLAIVAGFSYMFIQYIFVYQGEKGE